MPNLILFAPCERVIVEEGANTISLISILQSLTTEVPKDIDRKALAQHRWYVLVMWSREKSDSNTEFEQRIIVVDPQGTQVLEMLSTFSMTKDNHRNIGIIEGFPIAVEGRYALILSLRPKGSEKWIQRAEYPIQLAHAKKATT